MTTPLTPNMWTVGGSLSTLVCDGAAMPVASTIYPHHAQQIVCEHNAFQQLVTALEHAKSHLSVARSQSLLSDDAIIMGHMCDAEKLLDAALAAAKAGRVGA